MVDFFGNLGIGGIADHCWENPKIVFFLFGLVFLVIVRFKIYTAICINYLYSVM